MAVIHDGAIKFLLGGVGAAATNMSENVIGIEPDGLGVVSDGEIKVALGGVSDGTIVVGRGVAVGEPYRLG